MCIRDRQTLSDRRINERGSARPILKDTGKMLSGFKTTKSRSYSRTGRTLASATLTNKSEGYKVNAHNRGFNGERAIPVRSVAPDPKLHKLPKEVSDNIVLSFMTAFKKIL